MNPFGPLGRAAGSVFGFGGGGAQQPSTGGSVLGQFYGRNPPPTGLTGALSQGPRPGTLSELANPGDGMQRAYELASTGEGNGYDMGGNGVEGYYPELGSQQPIQGPGGLTVTDQVTPGTPNMDPFNPGWTLPPQPGDNTLPANQPLTPAWQHPQGAFAPNASQNAPRLFQDPTSGAWTLSEHGNFRPLTGEEVGQAQGYVNQFWQQNPTGFIQPGAPGYAPGQAMSNEQYGQPANWQSLWTNAGQQVPGMSSLTGGGGDSSMGGTLAELSNPERVNQLSASSYGSDNPFLVR